MNITILTLSLALATAQPATAQPAMVTTFAQVAPEVPQGKNDGIVRSANHSRAVVLVDGLKMQIWSHIKATKADLRPWQKPGSLLVRSLAKESDVFAFTYAQTVPITTIADLPALDESVRRLYRAGYTDVVFVGYSAGGIVARQFVEDHPNAGVSKVIQLCTPNDGSSLVNLKPPIGSAQKPFLQSLSPQSRSRTQEERQNKKIPDNVEFVCIIGKGLIFGDGAVSTKSQWPDDLQTQGVPAVVLDTQHWQVLHEERTAQVVSGLVLTKLPRWDQARVAVMRKSLWH